MKQQRKMKRKTNVEKLERTEKLLLEEEKERKGGKKKGEQKIETNLGKREKSQERQKGGNECVRS